MSESSHCLTVSYFGQRILIRAEIQPKFNPTTSTFTAAGKLAAYSIDYDRQETETELVAYEFSSVGNVAVGGNRLEKNPTEFGLWLLIDSLIALAKSGMILRP
jgi:hypothetical protein